MDMVKLLKLTKITPTLWVGQVDITPQLAEKLIVYNTVNYRTPSTAVYEGYGSVMSAGGWHLNVADNLVFQKEGPNNYLKHNGQHRLYAIIQSQTTQSFLVVLIAASVNPHIIDIDSGRGRSFAQYIKYRGHHPGSGVFSTIATLLYRHEHLDANPKILSAKIQNVEGWAAFKKYYSGIQFAYELTQGSGTGINAAYRTAIAKAYYNFDEDRIRQFNDQYKGLYCDDPTTDQAARLLGQYYARNQDKYSGGGAKRVEAYYLRCEKAIYAFCTYKNLTKLGPAAYTGQLIPLPDL